MLGPLRKNIKNISELNPTIGEREGKYEWYLYDGDSRAKKILRRVCTQLINDKNILVVIDKIRKVDKYVERI